MGGFRDHGVETVSLGLCKVRGVGSRFISKYLQ